MCFITNKVSLHHAPHSACFTRGWHLQRLGRAGTWGALAREKHFLFQEEDPEVTEQVDEESGPRTWSLQCSESAGPGLGGRPWTLLPQGCLPERQAC